MAFKKGQSGNPKGRPRNTVKRPPAALQKRALENLEEKLGAGDWQATIFVLERMFAKPKQYTDPKTVDAQMMTVRVEEWQQLKGIVSRLESERHSSNDKDKEGKVHAIY